MRCSSCHQSVQVPKLGDLRQLALVDDAPASGEELASRNETGLAPRLGLVVLGLIATAALLTAGYTGLRWALVKVEHSTESHLSELRENYPMLSSAELIREYEDMEKNELELIQPYSYQVTQDEKDHWGRIAMVASTILLLAVLGTIFVARSWRSPTPST
ncbi:hypothetical protein [Planctomycetes bacterium CA13]|uniref:hypothetical protein n=1 Tax=Novipirellula herctigrandis TaxID=2527986 RepID=UPI0011B41E8C